MAGLPDPVIDRAREILRHLESQHLAVEELHEGGDAGGDGIAAPAASASDVPEAGGPERFQMSLFGPEPDPVAEKIKERLREIDPNRVTPIEALLQLTELKRLLDTK